MTYTYGKDHIIKHKYGVYLRNYPATADISSKYYAPRLTDLLDATGRSKEQNLYCLAAACCNRNGLASLTTELDAGTTNEWHQITTSGADKATDLGEDYPGSKTAGDILVWEYYSKDAAYTLEVTDENDKTVALHNEGDIAVFIYTTKWEFWFYAAEGSDTPEEAGSQIYYYTQIGVCDESPSVKTSEGDTKATATEDELIISENIEVNATVLEVTKDNWEYLRTWADNEVDVIFYDVDNVQDGIGLENVAMQANLEATGNDLNTVPIILKKESSNIDNVFQFTYVGT